MGRPPNTTVNRRDTVVAQFPSELKQQLVHFAYAEQSTLTAVLIEAAEDFLAKNAHILSERLLRKQEQVEMLLREERNRQRAQRQQSAVDPETVSDVTDDGGPSADWQDER